MAPHRIPGRERPARRAVRGFPVCWHRFQSLPGEDSPRGGAATQVRAAGAADSRRLGGPGAAAANAAYFLVSFGQSPTRRPVKSIFMFMAWPLVFMVIV